MSATFALCQPLTSGSFAMPVNDADKRFGAHTRVSAANLSIEQSTRWYPQGAQEADTI